MSRFLTGTVNLAQLQPLPELPVRIGETGSSEVNGSLR